MAQEDQLHTDVRSAKRTTRRPSRRALIVSAVGIAAVAAVVAAVAILPTSPSNADNDAAGENQLNLETQTVARGDLTEQLRLQGTLGYSKPRAVGTGLEGTVTGLPGAGTVVTAGEELFRVNESPVILMSGEIPAWRGFEPGMVPGGDVLQLEENLSVLGFFGFAPDENFDANTGYAIRYWQKTAGLEETGKVELGRIFFSPTDLRVQDLKAQVGDAAGTEIVSVTDTNKVVQINVETSQQSLATPGTKVTVVLPGGTETTGTVTRVDAPTEVEGATGTSLKVPVVLALDDPAAGENLDNVAVTTVFSRVLGTDSLLVPVVALLAQPGGGFAVERLSGTATERVEVELGTFADGQVIVTGGGLAEGDTVVVAK